MLACGATLVGLAAAELGFRWLSPQALLHDPDAFVADPVLGTRMKPGFTDRVVTTEFSSTWIVNADGYRGPRAGERGEVARRVLALGDSFTFGYGVEEEQAWPRVLEGLLRHGDPQGAAVEVLNLGVGGYGTWQEALWLEEMAPRTKPDLAVVGFYVGNDPSDNARAAAQSGQDGVQRGAPSGGFDAERAKRWLGSRLHLYSFVSTRADELLVRLGLRQLVYPFEMEILRAREPAEVAQAWRRTQQAFTRLAAVARGAGVPVIVAIIPMKHQVSDAVWRRLLVHYGDDAAPADWDRERPQRQLAYMLGAEGLDAVDLLEGLRVAGAEGQDLYWPRDQHWNVRGHAAAARVIAEKIGPLLRGSGSE